MNPFIFLFRESPTKGGHDFSYLSYDSFKNLTVNTLTGEPAISVLNMATETFTKADGESSDVDRNDEILLMGTQTQTYSNLEASDSDDDLVLMRMLMGTSTETRTLIESSDQD